jgi:hypothetical protein
LEAFIELRRTADAVQRQLNYVKWQKFIEFSYGELVEYREIAARSISTLTMPDALMKESIDSGHIHKNSKLPCIRRGLELRRREWLPFPPARLRWLLAP